MNEPMKPMNANESIYDFTLRKLAEFATKNYRSKSEGLKRLGEFKKRKLVYAINKNSCSLGVYSSVWEAVREAGINEIVIRAEDVKIQDIREEMKK
jgi:succinyl-CoA synthetase alpha subunit